MPWPAETLVTGWHRESELCVRSSCRAHLWLTMSDPAPVDYACGFIQAAQCIVCEYITPLIDADWWYEQASPRHIADLATLLMSESARLVSVVDRLDRPVSPFVAMVNFDG